MRLALKSKPSFKIAATTIGAETVSYKGNRRPRITLYCATHIGPDAVYGAIPERRNGQKKSQQVKPAVVRAYAR